LPAPTWGGCRGGWTVRGLLAMDVARAARLRCRGYRVTTHRIPGEITPKNQLLLAEPEP